MYASELRTCALGAVVCVLLGAGMGSAGITWTPAVDPVPFPRLQLPSRSRRCPAFHCRALLLRGKPRFSKLLCFLVYPATRNQPKATRNALRATPAGSTNLTAWVLRPRRFDDDGRMPSGRRGRATADPLRSHREARHQPNLRGVDCHEVNVAHGWGAV